ncbi:proprotein convertase subtilisin/kexin type 5-like [Ostrea edulis]|uniref:proprotein convertase subtilisin/kexin type 5-like n=1 Tax=Ostrea edulis TaxID=37623 RepID=UPI0024AF3706|nr:proprotein convertase subtilisin/kexin type 5-like [Ostrea edulis]
MQSKMDVLLYVVFSYLAKISIAICPPSEVTLYGKSRCLKECPWRSYMFRQICYEECPVNTRVIVTELGKFCSVDHEFECQRISCPDEFPLCYKMNCLKTCPKYTFQFLNNCVIECPEEQAFKLSHDCEESCLPGKCLESCPPSHPFVFQSIRSKHCLQQCPNYTYEDIASKACKSECPMHSPFLFNKTCLKTCPESHPFASTVESMYNSISKCFNSCPSDAVIDGDYCVSVCPRGKHLFNNTCVVTCPTSHPLMFPNTIRFVSPIKSLGKSDFICVDSCNVGSNVIYQYNIYNNFCVDSCPQESHYAYNGSCLTECPVSSKYNIHHGKYFLCVESCPVNTFVSNETNCRRSCPSDENFLYNNTCNETCPSDYNFKQIAGSYYKCNAACPSEEFIYNDSFCVASCPPEAKYQYDKTCVTTCSKPLKYQLSNSTTIHRNRYNKTTVNHHYCLEDCPPNTNYYEDACVMECPSQANYLFNRSCHTGCPAPYNYRFLSGKHHVCCDECPQNTFTYNATLCLSACPVDKNFEFNNTCYNKCPDSNDFIFQESSHFKCLDKCSSKSLKTLNKTCLNECPQGTLQLDNKCVQSCPSDRPLNYTRNDGKHCCQNSCPYRTYRFESKCFDRCPHGFRTFNFTCTLECPKSTPYIDIVTKKCLSTCENDFVITNNHQCDVKCPHDKQYIEKKRCVKGKIQNMCVKFCSKQNSFSYIANQGIFCYDQCPNHLLLMENQRTCVEECPDNKLIVGSICRAIYKCPNHKYLEHTDVGKRCKNECSLGFFLDGVHCVKECPLEKVIVNAKCAEECPSSHPLIHKDFTSSKPRATCYFQCPGRLVANGSTCIDETTCHSTKHYTYEHVCYEACPMLTRKTENYTCFSLTSSILYTILLLILTIIQLGVLYFVTCFTGKKSNKKKEMEGAMIKTHFQLTSSNKDREHNRKYVIRFKKEEKENIEIFEVNTIGSDEKMENNEDVTELNDGYKPINFRRRKH